MKTPIFSGIKITVIVDGKEVTLESPNHLFSTRVKRKKYKSTGDEAWYLEVRTELFDSCLAKNHKK